jgi:hypothetical protein
MKKQRANPAFVLVRTKLEHSALPVLDTENITCWENLEFSLLSLENEQFDILWRDFKSKSKEQLKKKEIIKLKAAPKKTSDEENIDIESIKDEIVAEQSIFEMEKAFAEGDNSSLMDMLKKYQ